MFGELRGKTGHDFLIWKVKRRVGNYMPKPACCCQADSALTSTNVYRYDYNLVPQLYVIVCIIYECYLSKV
jgi:hypothetical protein